MKNRICFLLFIGFMLGCTASKTSSIVADSYDASNNITTLTLFPYGNIDIPGQWKRTHYYEISKQYFFEDVDSTSIAVTLNPLDMYPFYDKSLTDRDFTRKFYEWERVYYEEQGFKITEKHAEDNFIIWAVSGQNTNTTLLYGTKNKLAYNFAVFGNNWAEEKKIDFLKKLFAEN